MKSIDQPTKSRVATFLKILIQSFCFLLLFSCAGANEEKPFDGLRQMTLAEQSASTLTLTPSIPSYTKDNKLIPAEEWGNYMNSEQFDREYYLDEKGEIKAIVFVWKRKQERALAPKEQPTAIAVGSHAPGFTATDLERKPITLSILKGKVVVLNFWFTSCKPCIEEMPDLNEVKSRFSNNVQFLAITFDSKEQVIKFLKKVQFDYSILPGAEKLCKEWDINLYPTNVVIDQQGIVRYIKYGFDENIGDRLSQEINSLLK